ncbi:MAG: AsmA-like C-terminal domain-containing protein [Planctomycetota bacterium]
MFRIIRQISKQGNKQLARHIVIWLAVLVLLYVSNAWFEHAAREFVVARIEKLTAMRVELDSLSFRPNGSIQIKNLTVYPVKETTTGISLLRAETLYARFSLLSLVSAKPRLEELSVKDYVLNIRYDADTGKLNVPRVTFSGSKSRHRKIPEIKLKKGMLRFSKVLKDTAQNIAVLPFSFELNADKQEGIYNFQIYSTDGQGQLLTNLTGILCTEKPGRISCSGRINSLELPIFGNVWNIDNVGVRLEYNEDGICVENLRAKLASGTEISLNGRIVKFFSDPAMHLQAEFKNLLAGSVPTDDAFVYTPALLQILNKSLQRFFTEYQPHGTVDVNVEAAARLAELSKIQCKAKMFCTDIAVCYRGFPYLIEHLRGPIDLTEKSAVLNALKGTHGDVNLLISGYTKDFGKELDCKINLTSDNMNLDDDLYRALATAEQKLWFDFSPTGRCTVDYLFLNNPAIGKKMSLAVGLLGGTATYRHFPYPLKNLSGRLVFDPCTLTLKDVTSTHNGSKIVLNGQITQVQSETPQYSVSIDAESVPLDGALKASLPDSQHRFCEDFDVNGVAAAQIKISTAGQKSSPVNFAGNLKITANSLKHRQFPFVFNNVFIDSRITQDFFQIEKMTADCGDGKLSLQGKVLAAYTTDEKIQYDLALQATSFRLNDGFVDLLPQGAADLFTQLNAQGSINLVARFKNIANTSAPQTSVAVQCLQNTINFEKFPYPLKDICGTLVISPNSITFQNITAAASHSIRFSEETSAIILDGAIGLDKKRLTEGQFTFSAQNLPLDNRIGRAIDKILPGLYDRFVPTGKVDLDLPDIQVAFNESGKKQVRLRGSIGFRNCSLGSDHLIAELNGTMTAGIAHTTGENVLMTGTKFAAETVRVNGRMLQNVYCTIEYDPNNSLWSISDLVADCYEGRVAAAFELQRPNSTDFAYELQAAFENVDADRFLSAPNEPQVHKGKAGRINGFVSLTADEQPDSRKGVMKLSIHDMKAGRASVLAKILSVMNFSLPKDFIFSDMTIEAYIKAEQMILSKVDIQGDAFALKGSGKMNLENKNIDIDFIAAAPRLLSEPPALESIAEGISPALVKVKVEGNLYNPEVKTKTLPVIKDTLNLLGEKAE